MLNVAVLAYVHFTDRHYSNRAAEMRATMTRQQVLDLYYLDARCKLIDLAAFLDRIDRASGESDFRLRAFREALQRLGDTGPHRAEQVLLALSDPTAKPIPQATTKAACGAWPGPGPTGGSQSS